MGPKGPMGTYVDPLRGALGPGFQTPRKRSNRRVSDQFFKVPAAPATVQPETRSVDTNSALRVQRGASRGPGIPKTPKNARNPGLGPRPWARALSCDPREGIHVDPLRVTRRFCDDKKRVTA